MAIIHYNISKYIRFCICRNINAMGQSKYNLYCHYIFCICICYTCRFRIIIRIKYTKRMDIYLT